MKTSATANLQQIPNIEDAANSEPVAKSDFTATMRNVASSVSVVTTDGEAGRHGGTVSSFCSVSADPPTMLVCLNRASQIAATVAANGCFSINVLPASANYIADRFAGVHDNEISDRFIGIEYSNSKTGPALANAVVLGCRVQEIVESGSHYIITGLVHKVDRGHAQPLAYLNGAYHAVVAQVMEVS